MYHESWSMGLTCHTTGMVYIFLTESRAGLGHKFGPGILVQTGPPQPARTEHRRSTSPQCVEAAIGPLHLLAAQPKNYNSSSKMVAKIVGSTIQVGLWATGPKEKVKKAAHPAFARYARWPIHPCLQLGNLHSIALNTSVSS